MRGREGLYLSAQVLRLAEQLFLFLFGGHWKCFVCTSLLWLLPTDVAIADAFSAESIQKALGALKLSIFLFFLCVFLTLHVDCTWCAKLQQTTRIFKFCMLHVHLMTRVTGWWWADTEAVVAASTGSVKKFMNLDFVRKLRAIRHVEVGKNNSTVAYNSGIPRSTLSTLLKNKADTKSKVVEQ